MIRSMFHRKTRIRYAFAVPLLALTLASSAVLPSAADSPAPASGTVQAQADTSRTCANKARAQAKKNTVKRYWTCVGNKARYFSRHVPTTVVTKQDDGTFTGWGSTPDDKSSETVPGAKGEDTVSTQDIFDDDQRCELVPECTNIRTLYRADIKGNGFYGYADQIWGSFDVLLLQTFSGASSRYRLTLMWDHGYQIDSLSWRAAVRHNSVLPDQTTGTAYFRLGYISSNRWNVIAPSSTTFVHTTPTPYLGKHHDDFNGEFIANNRMFFTGTIHLPNFHCPDHLCKYYGPTGPV